VRAIHLFKVKDNPQLKQYIITAKFSENKSKTFKITKCGGTKRGLCKYLREGDVLILTGIYFVKQRMSCDVENVIHCLIFNGWGTYCFGQTGDKLRMRRTAHTQQVRNPFTRKLPLSEHLDICCETEPKCSIFPFYKWFSLQSSARLAKEQYFKKIFKPPLNAK